MSTPFFISKTSFLKFDQCSKSFFLYKKFPQLKDTLTKEKQLIFNRGNKIGVLAQQLFPGGIDVSLQTNNLQQALDLTRELVLKKQPVIYEATFVFNSVLVMVDVLHLNETGYTAYEVKSSLKISDVYIKDACLQYYVLKNTLNNVCDFFLVTINPEYTLREKTDVKMYFKKRSIKQNAEKNLSFFEEQIKNALFVLEKNTVPDLPVGKHCFSPYQCDFLGACWKNTNNPKSIFNLGKIDKDVLYNWHKSGIDTVDKIPNLEKQLPQVQIQVNCMLQQQEFFNKEALTKWFTGLDENCAFLDMEVWSPAVPVYQNTNPFEQIPFLFSLCFNSGETIQFKEYLKPVNEDARDMFLVELLKATSDFSKVIVFDKNLEVGILSQLQKKFPDYSESIQSLTNKLYDLADIVNHLYYYHPGLKGNFSLKGIASVVYPESTYNNLEISSGIIAMNVYESLLKEINPIIAETKKQQLVDYCNMDTISCLRFFRYLKEKIKE